MTRLRLVALVGALLLVSACVEGQDSPASLAVATKSLAQGAEGLADPGAATAPSSIPLGLPVPTLELLDEASSVTSATDLAALFGVSPEQAEAFAHGWATQRGYLAAPVTTCAVVPVTGVEGVPMAYQVVMTDLPGSCDWEILASRAGALTAEITSVSHPTRSSLLQARTVASYEHFATLAVSAWSFLHPIKDGHRGLPLWLLTIDELPTEVPKGATPTALYPMGNDQGLVDVIEYTAGDQVTLFSHYAGMVVPREALSVSFEPASLLAAVSKADASPAVREAWADKLGGIWLGYLPSEVSK